MNRLSPKPAEGTLKKTGDVPLDLNAGEYLIVLKSEKSTQVFHLKLDSDERVDKNSTKLKLLGKINLKSSEEIIAIKL